jgi:hypothetical protein
MAGNQAFGPRWAWVVLLLGGAEFVSAMPAAGMMTALVAPMPAEQVAVTARLATRAIVVAPGSRAQTVVTLALGEFGRVDDVVRMVLEPPEIGPYREQDHVELVFEPARAIAIAPQGATVRVSRLLVPLSPERTQPDWFFFAQPEAGKTWGVYRWRGADPGQVAALRQLVQQLGE